jgi:hypothetical protein
MEMFEGLKLRWLCWDVTGVRGSITTPRHTVQRRECEMNRMGLALTEQNLENEACDV